MQLSLATETGTLDVLEACLTIPASGLWRAELLVDSDDPADTQGQGTLTLQGEAGPRTFRGAFLQASVFAGRTRARFIPAVGLLLPLPSKFYHKASVGAIVGDILQSVQESLDPTSDHLSVILGAWSRREVEAASIAIQDLCAELKTSWFVTESGLVHLGERVASEYTGEFNILREDPIRAIEELDLPALDLLPGQTLDGRTIDRLTLEISAAKTFIRVRYGA